MPLFLKRLTGNVPCPRRKARRLLATFLLLVLLPTSSLGSGQQPIPATGHPNFIVIVADDLGYGDLRCYGGNMETPEIDRMAGGGMRFTDFHSSGPVCSPTRAGLMTGRYQERAGLEEVILANFDRNRHWGLQPREVTLPALLQASGYATGLVGKWHLGSKPVYNPLGRGFQFFRGYLGGNIDYFDHIDRVGVPDWWNGREAVVEEGYLTDLITQHALDFIRRNQSTPFFLLVTHAAPHFPYQAPGDSPFRQVGKLVENSLDFESPGDTYARMLQRMDEGVGQILRLLEELRLEEQTLVFFFSDNGANKNGSNRPFRGVKAQLWEGGHRVPAIAWWPGHISAGTVNPSLTMSIDLMPTILGIAGIAPPQDHILDGRNLQYLMRENAELSGRRLFWRFRGKHAVRENEWKLIDGENGLEGYALYNLESDPSEEVNLASRFPKTVEVMQQALREWERSVDEDATPQPAR